jgi:CRP-like cAMP-binding protein
MLASAALQKRYFPAYKVIVVIDGKGTVRQNLLGIIFMPRKPVPMALQKQLESVATLVRKPKGTFLFRTGQPCRGAFLIRRGQVELSLEGASHLYAARLVGAGGLIGLPAAFSGEPYSLTAETKSMCDLDFIPRGKLLDILRRNPRFGFEIVKLLSEEIFQMRKAAKRSLPIIKKS